VATVEIMAVDGTWRTSDGRWLVDRVVDEPGVGFRIWFDEELVGKLASDVAALRQWLAAQQVDIDELVQLDPEDDPYCE
jgi:hypothetical protein